MLFVASRLAGGEAIAAQAVWAASAVSIAFGAVRVILVFGGGPETIFAADRVWSLCVWPLIHLPLAIVLWRRHPVLALVAFISAAYVMSHHVTRMHFFAGEMRLVDGVRVVAGIALVALVTKLSLSEPKPLRAIASKVMRGTTRVAVMWTISAVVLQMIAMMRLYELGAVRMFAITYAFSYAICLGLLGYGLARAASEVAQWTAAIAAALLLCCAGVLAAQLPWIYRMFWDTSSWSDARPAPYATAFATALPVVITLACALFSLAIATFGARHGDKDLVGEARGRGIALVIMFMASQRITVWLVPTAGSAELHAVFIMAAAILNVLAAYQFARLWDSAARALSQPGLPAARALKAP
jgi:hypothetical protein